MTAMSPHTILPPDPIIFPGSFNPPHAGHVALADAARRAMGRKRDEEFRHGEEERRRHRVEFGGGTEEFMMSALDYHDVKRGPPGILFEISLTNPDKDPISADEASKRVRLFLQRLEGEETEEKTKTTHPRMDWGVLLTSSPLFVQKAETVAECLSERGGKSANGGRKTSSRTRKMTFVIGADTMVRIVDPKYYGNSRDDMLEAVRDMGNRGVHFVGGGRLEQNKGKGKEDEGAGARFVTGEEELSSLPDDVREMFTIIKEEDFRIDLSSTEIRRREAAKTEKKKKKEEKETGAE